MTSTDPHGELVKAMRAALDAKSYRARIESSRSADVKFVGTDTLDGSPMMVYQYTLKGQQGKGFNVASKTWVGAADNLPRKTESEGEMEVMNKHVETKATLTYSDYGADIRIAPPL